MGTPPRQANVKDPAKMTKGKPCQLPKEPRRLRLADAKTKIYTNKTRVEAPPTDTVEPSAHPAAAKKPREETQHPTKDLRHKLNRAKPQGENTLLTISEQKKVKPTTEKAEATKSGETLHQRLPQSRTWHRWRANGWK